MIFKDKKVLEELESTRHELMVELRILQEELKQVKNDVKDALIKLGELNRLQLELDSKISLIQNGVHGDKKPQPALRSSSFVKSQSPVAVKRQEIPVIKKFAQQLNGNDIKNNSLQDNETKFTKFILKIQGNIATFEVPVSSECQEKLLNGFNTIVPFIAEIERTDTPTAIENVKEGKLELKDGVWNVVEKLQVKLK